MHCSLCYTTDGKLEMFKGELNDDIFKRITFVLPDLTISDQESVPVCSTCLEQVTYFNEIKEACLQNLCRLKQFNTSLKEANKNTSKELKIINNSVEESEQPIPPIEFGANVNCKYLLENQDSSLVNEKEYDDYNQQLVDDETSLNHLKDDESSSNSYDSTEGQRKKRWRRFIEDPAYTTLQGQRFYIKTSLKNRFKCKDCPKMFNLRTVLKQHTRVHTGDKPYKCPTCDKTFTHAAYLKNHKKRHTGESKRFKCTKCDKKFTKKVYFDNHNRLHIKETPCPICQMTFIRIDRLNVHKRRCEKKLNLKLEKEQKEKSENKQKDKSENKQKLKNKQNLKSENKQKQK